jgi:integrase
VLLVPAGFYGYNWSMDEQTQLPQVSRSRKLSSSLQAAGQSANVAAARYRFDEYRARRAAETVRRQDADLVLFAEFLYTAGVQAGSLSQDPSAWQGVTWGLVEAFIQWQLKEGYAVSSVNVRLSTIKTYARLAFQAGIIDAETYATIRAVQGYSQREKRRIDAQRPVQRVGLKKEMPQTLSRDQAEALKRVTGEGFAAARDVFLMCLLLDHGLRVGEVAGLTIESIDLTLGLLRFYRPKVARAQVHRLSPATREAARNYLNLLGKRDPSAALFRRIKRNGQPGSQPLTARAIAIRVQALGAGLGLAHLSPHDCRHYWATAAAHGGTDPFSLQEAGGWSSLAMPRRYIDQAMIANSGVRLNPPDSQRQPDDQE